MEDGGIVTPQADGDVIPVEEMKFREETLAYMERMVALVGATAPTLGALIKAVNPPAPESFKDMIMMTTETAFEDIAEQTKLAMLAGTYTREVASKILLSALANNLTYMALLGAHLGKASLL